MDKRILDIILDFNLWRGDMYRLAALVADMQRTICEEEYAAKQVTEE